MKTKSKPKMNYKTIKWVLRHNAKRKVNTFWTWDKKANNFTQIYKNYSHKLPIYTATQLLAEIEKEINSNTTEEETVL